MIVLLDAMEWKHLPSAGGIYDQHPDFIEKMKYYMGQKARAAKEKNDRGKTNPRAPVNQGVSRRR